MSMSLSRHLATISPALAAYRRRNRRETAANLAAVLFSLGGGEINSPRNGPSAESNSAAYLAGTGRGAAVSVAITTTQQKPNANPVGSDPRTQGHAELVDQVVEARGGHGRRPLNQTSSSAPGKLVNADLSRSLAPARLAARAGRTCEFRRYFPRPEKSPTGSQEHGSRQFSEVQRPHHHSAELMVSPALPRKNDWQDRQC